jgi:hypothetical protein
MCATIPRPSGCARSPPTAGKPRCATNGAVAREDAPLVPLGGPARLHAVVRAVR